MRGRHGQHFAEAVAGEFRADGVLVGAVDLVDQQQRRARQLAQPGQDLVVHRRGALAGIDDEQDQISFGRSSAGLARSGASQAFLFLGNTAGVHDEEMVVLVQTADAVVAVAGDAGLVMDQGVTRAGQSIEDGRLADIRPSNQGDQRQHRDYSVLICQPECGQLAINILHQQHPVDDDWLG